MSITDSFSSLTAREQKALEKSWVKVFADEIFLEKALKGSAGAHRFLCNLRNGNVKICKTLHKG